MRRLLSLSLLAVCAAAQEQTFHGTIYFSRAIDARAATGSTAPIKHITADLAGSCGGAAFGLALNTTNKKLFWCNPGTGNWELAITFGATGGAAAWGSITGVLTDQADLTAALNGKAATVHAHSGADITSGTLLAARGGTGTGSATSNAVLVGDGTGWTLPVLPSCSDGTTSKLLYNNSTRTFSCGTDQSGGAGGGITSLGATGSPQTGATQTFAATFVNATAFGVSSAGNIHTWNFPFATQAEAEGGIVTNKIMTPERVAQAIAKLTPLPETPSLGYLKYNGTITEYQPFWAIAPTAAAISAVGNSITCLSSQIAATPASSLTLTSTPTVTDGVDGQFCTITNVSTTNTLTLQDAANLAGSGLRLGGSNVTLPARGSITLVFNTAMDAWLRTNDGGGGGGGGTGQIIKEVEFRNGCQNSIPISALNLMSTPGDANTPLIKCVYGTNTIFGVLEFTAVGQYGTGDVRLPTGTASVTLTLESRTSSTTGNMVYTVTNSCVATGGDEGTGDSAAPAGGPPLSQSNTFTIGANATAFRTQHSPETTLTISSCPADSRMIFKIALATSTATTPQLRNAIFRFKN